MAPEITDVTFWLPMGFIIVGVLLFLWEVSQPGFFIAVPATVLIVLGVIGLVIPPFLFSIYAPIVAIVVAIPTTAGAIRVYRKLAPPTDRPETTIGESLVGRTGTVTAPIVPDVTTGKVRIDGVIWSARTEGDPIPVGARVEIVQSRGVHVVVRPVATQTKAPTPDPDEAAPDDGSPTTS